MPHASRPKRSASSVPSWIAALCAVLAAGSAAGCKLIDQRTFDAHANTKPVPHVAPGPVVAAVLPTPPLASVRFGAPPDSWQPGVADIVRLALARKPDALFRVQTVVPARGTPQAQAAALADAGRTGGRLVAETIVSAGASSAQVEMTAMSDASVTQPEVRVYVK